MDHKNLVTASGVVHLNLVREDGSETGRSIDINPSDQGFAEDLYGLVSKIEQIHMEKRKLLETEEDTAARFDICRSEDREMRAVVDGLFGENFCRDVFGAVRLFALANGLTVIENLLFALLDEMDDSITANIAKRDERVQKYIQKYKKYRK